MGYINLTDRSQISNTVMAYSAFAFYGSFGLLIFALVPVSLSRVLAASRPKVYDQVWRDFYMYYKLFVLSALFGSSRLVDLPNSRYDPGDLARYYLCGPT
jgi:hypothetical protein